MKVKLTLAIFLCVCLTMPAISQAELQLMENGEGRAPGKASVDFDNTVLNGVAGGFVDTEGEGTGNIWIETVLPDDSLTIRCGSNSSGDERGYALTGVSDPIEVGETGLLFFRMRHRNEVKVVFGYFGLTDLTMIDTGDDPMDDPECNDRTTFVAGFEVISAERETEGAEVRTLDGDVAGEGMQFASIALDQWYNVWIEADHANDIFSVYIEEAAGPGSPPPAAPSSAPVLDSYVFTRTTTEPLSGVAVSSPDGETEHPTNTPDAGGKYGTSRIHTDDFYWDGSNGLKTARARLDEPKNGANIVPLTQVLRWLAPNDPNVAEVRGYNVYVDPNDVLVAGRDPSVLRSAMQSELFLDPGLTLFNTEYFWAVDTTVVYDNDPNPDDPNLILESGSLWRFTTRPELPVIITDPVSQVCGTANGKPDAVFTIEAASATGYQWYKDDGALEGETADTLTITDVQLADDGLYHCDAINLGGAVSSAPAYLEYARQTGQWDFEGDLVDSLGGNNGIPTAVLEEMPGFGAGRTGTSAISFDGVDDYVNIPVEALPETGIEFSIAFWVQANTMERAMTPFYADAPTANPGLRLLSIYLPNSTGTVGFHTSNVDETGYDILGEPLNATTDPWVHLVFTKYAPDGVTRIYQNGDLLDESTNDFRWIYGAEQFLFGGSLGAIAEGDFFDGLIDDLKIFNYALSRTQVAYMYTDVVTDASICVDPDNPILQAYDIDGDCRIALGDLARIASEWLSCFLVPDCIPRP